MIRLTSIDGTQIYVNPNQITSIMEGSATHAEVYIEPGQFYCVSESPEEVARKVLEWRLALTQHSAYLHLQDWENAHKSRDILRNLAGLEETK